MVHIVRAFSIFKNQKKAVELCTNRFDDATRLAFVDLFDKVSAGELDVQEAPTHSPDGVDPVIDDVAVPNGATVTITQTASAGSSPTTVTTI